MRVPFALLGIVWLLAIGAIWYGINQRFTGTSDTTGMMSAADAENGMRITSTAFGAGSSIPARYTCDDGEESPPLAIEGVPEGAASLALVMEDPDVPKTLRADGLYVHWVLYDIPAATRAVPEGGTPGTLGQNTAGERAYAGPCPPPQYEPREHRYVFTLYALDTMLGLREGASKEELLTAMEGHILGTAQLVGRYARSTVSS